MEPVTPRPARKPRPTDAHPFVPYLRRCHMFVVRAVLAAICRARSGRSRMSNPKRSNAARLIAIPIIFLFVFASLYFVWKLLDLPSEDVLLGIARSYFERYGLITVFIGAFIEGLLLIG